ncbi:MAG: hypothetical protein VX154_00515 [Pseudomonadota bacterium]|nr:hypothetical protein [Pseudomonadota bacterium]
MSSLSGDTLADAFSQSVLEVLTQAKELLTKQGRFRVCTIKGVTYYVDRKRLTAKARSVSFSYNEFAFMVDANTNIDNMVRRHLNKKFCGLTGTPSGRVLGPYQGPITGKELENERHCEMAGKSKLKRYCLKRRYSI